MKNQRIRREQKIVVPQVPLQKVGDTMTWWYEFGTCTGVTLPSLLPPHHHQNPVNFFILQTCASPLPLFQNPVVTDTLTRYSLGKPLVFPFAFFLLLNYFTLPPLPPPLERLHVRLQPSSHDACGSKPHCRNAGCHPR